MAAQVHARSRRRASLAARLLAVLLAAEPLVVALLAVAVATSSPPTPPAITGRQIAVLFQPTGIVTGSDRIAGLVDINIPPGVRRGLVYPKGNVVRLPHPRRPVFCWKRGHKSRHGYCYLRRSLTRQKLTISIVVGKPGSRFLRRRTIRIPLAQAFIVSGRFFGQSGTVPRPDQIRFSQKVPIRLSIPVTIPVSGSQEDFPGDVYSATLAPIRVSLGKLWHYRQAFEMDPSRVPHNWSVSTSPAPVTAKSAVVRPEVVKIHRTCHRRGKKRRCIVRRHVILPRAKIRAAGNLGVSISLSRPLLEELFVYSFCLLPLFIFLGLVVYRWSSDAAGFRQEVVAAAIGAVFSVMPLRFVLVPGQIQAPSRADYMLALSTAAIILIGTIAIVFKPEIEGELDRTVEMVGSERPMPAAAQESPQLYRVL